MHTGSVRGRAFKEISAHEQAGVAPPFSARTTHMPGNCIDSTTFQSETPSSCASRQFCAVFPVVHSWNSTASRAVAVRHPSGPVTVLHTPVHSNSVGLRRQHRCRRRLEDAGSLRRRPITTCESRPSGTAEGRQPVLRAAAVNLPNANAQPGAEPHLPGPRP